MPTTGTQTPWSWLQDLAATAHLHEQGPGESRSIDEPTVEPSDSERCGGSSCETCEVEHNNHQASNTTPALNQEDSARTSGSYSPVGLKLPPLVKEGECSQPEQHAGLADHEPIKKEDLKLPPVLMQLQDCDFSSPSEESGDEHEDEEEEESEAADKFPDLTSNLPLPAILQYLRESESIASDYFSLENKQKLSDSHKQVEPSEPATSLLPEKCEFCGINSQRHGLLNLTGDETETPFCCEEYKEFCLLVAGCMRQMVEKRKQERPRKISIEPNKKMYKETAEEKAMAMLCRKKKWEELRKKRKQMEKLQSSSFYSLTKQTKTIQFSLVSPTAQHTEWLVAQESSSRTRAVKNSRVVFRKHKGRKQEKEGKKLEELPLQLLDRLKAEAPPLGKLDVRQYSNGKKLANILPDKTGQCYYPSGNTALMICMPYKGVLSYLLFEDSDHPRLLAHIDELGRACCYHSDGGTRFLRTLSLGLLFDQHGSLKKRWLWKDCSKSASLFQPVTIAFNKQLSVKCTAKEMIVIHFSAQQQQLKFLVPCKLKEDEVKALADSPLAERVKTMEDLFHTKKTRINQLMLALQQSHRVQKMAELHSVYAPRSKHGHSESLYATRTRHSGHNEPHKKTRSTGALDLHKPANKHTVAVLKPLMH